MAAKRPDPGTLYCSFCYGSEHEVKALVAGPGVYICDACTELSQKAIKGKRIPGFPGPDALDSDRLLDRLAPASFAVGAAERSLRDQVGALRRKGVTWEQIGAALGTSRQAAHQRFSE